MERLSPGWVIALFVFHLVVLLALLAVWVWRRKPKTPILHTEGQPLKLPRREGTLIRVPYDTEVTSVIELNGEKLRVTGVVHDFNPAGCQTYAQTEPLIEPPSRYDLLMRDDDEA